MTIAERMQKSWCGFTKGTDDLDQQLVAKFFQKLLIGRRQVADHSPTSFINNLALKSLETDWKLV